MIDNKGLSCSWGCSAASLPPLNNSFSPLAQLCGFFQATLHDSSWLEMKLTNSTGFQGKLSRFHNTVNQNQPKS